MKDNNESMDSLNTEIEKRISEMEQKTYIFPKRFSKTDYIVVAVIAVFCLGAVIAGGFIS